MSTAVEKTKELKRKEVPIHSLEPNDLNPNEMSDAEFNMLYDNMEAVGITDPILVRPHPEKKKAWRIIGGHHRWEVAKLQGFETVPVTIIEDESFDEDQEKFQMVRHNIIHGRMSPQKFMSLYETVQEKYSAEIAAEAFGFVDEDEFRKLINQTAKQLPPEMQEQFKEAAKDIKTIDGLAKILNELFALHGDSLPYGYMFVDFGGKESIWLRMEKGEKKNFMALATLCREQGRTLDGAMAALLQIVAKDNDLAEKLVELSPEVDLENVGEDDLPTLDFLDTL